LVAAQVPPERIFIVESSAAPEAKGDLRLSRVDFVIK
jgi:hypothetical protein